jgi:hypothetical protein
MLDLLLASGQDIDLTPPWSDFQLLMLGNDFSDSSHHKFS